MTSMSVVRFTEQDSSLVVKSDVNSVTKYKGKYSLAAWETHIP